MKRIFFLCSALVVLISLSSCEFLVSKSSENSSVTSSIASSSEVVSSSEDSTNSSTVESTDSSKESSSSSTDGNPAEYLKKNGPFTSKCIPSIGSPKILVLPIGLDSSKSTTFNLNLINTAFNGSEAQTGFESVKSYYQESSYGKLNFDFVVPNKWFTPSKSKKYYNDYYSSITGEDGSMLLLKEALTYFNSTYDYSDFDSDNDGYIDAVWMIYNCDIDYIDDNTIYWAFQDNDVNENSYDGVKTSYYAFAGLGFTSEDTDLYETSDIKVDAHTYIHETGHLLGLDDYYDYASSIGAKGGLYYADMMDYNIGDHGMLSKLLLGWVTPTVVTSDAVISLSSFTETGNFILVHNGSYSSIYSEYYLIELYTTTGLNAHDEPITVSGKNYGIRVIHADATKNLDSRGNEVMHEGNYYYTGFKYNNSDTSYLMVDQLRADNSSHNSEYVSTNSLFTTSLTSLKEKFPSYKTAYRTGLFFDMAVLELSSSSAKIEITF